MTPACDPCLFEQLPTAKSPEAIEDLLPHNLKMATVSASKPTTRMNYRPERHQ